MTTSPSHLCLKMAHPRSLRRWEPPMRVTQGSQRHVSATSSLPSHFLPKSRRFRPTVRSSHPQSCPAPPIRREPSPSVPVVSRCYCCYWTAPGRLRGVTQWHVRENWQTRVPSKREKKTSKGQSVREFNIYITFADYTRALRRLQMPKGGKIN